MPKITSSSEKTDKKISPSSKKSSQKKEIGTKPKKKTAKTVVAKSTPKEEPKAVAVKANELLGSNSFLSGLGFGPKQENTQVTTSAVNNKKEDLSVQGKKSNAPETAQKSNETFGNATVIRSATKEESEQYAQKNSQSPNRRFTKRIGAHGGGHFVENQKKGESTQTSINEPIRFRSFVEENKQHQQKKQEQTNYHNSKHSQPHTPEQKREKEQKTSATLVKKETIVIDDFVTVKVFSEKMGVPIMEVIKSLLSNKIVAGINANIDFDTASLIAEEFNVTVVKKTQTVSLDTHISGDLQSILQLDKEAKNLQERPPIVTIMGHVDHGKTSLLDYLRKTTIASGEAGGITQSIGGSSVTYNNKKITFIDTPGHELFTALRARGAKLTNIVVIVVAADDGIKQQTIEAINHAKDSKVPIIVAITKIDKGDHNVEMIKSQLTEHGITPEERGGDVPIVKVSSHTGQGIDDLLEHIILQSEMLELKYNPGRNAIGVVLEAHKDAKQGVTTSMIVMTGTLKVGDIVVVHNTYGKIKKIMDRTGKEVKTASGGDPIMVLGIQDVPEPGRIAEVVANEKIANARVSEILQQISKTTNKSSLQNFLNQLSQGEIAQLKLIIKSDGFGSLEALKHAIIGIKMPENIEIKIVHADMGNFSDSDLALAQASGSLLLGFNINLTNSFKKKADHMNVTVKNFDIIYELIDYLEKIVQGMIKVEEKEVHLGTMKVLAVFYKKEKDMIIGGKITEGVARNGALFRILRGEEIIGTGKITSLKKEQENVDEISQGYECGLKVRVSKKIVENDILDFYVME